ncbi:hypothetical protein [Mycobacterium sp. NPDC006124]|uniref:hypothetical protein n=1 Tax=Mycobacterium sp. NPDC006124 TaxID=3156729 RepID=UPI0033B2DA49
MTTQPLALPRPAAALREHALRTAGLRSHRALVDGWLRAADVAGVEQLLDALGGRDTTSTALLLSEHRRGVGLAATLLLGAKAVMLSSVARHAPGDCLEERFQVTVDAFLSRALPAVRPSHKHADAQLYWITLRTVTKMHEAPMCSAEPSFEDVAGEDVHAEADSYLTADVLLDWALSRGVLAEQDHRALKIRFGGDAAVPVREVAALMGVTENKLESRLRRALTRLRDAVESDRDDLDRACVAARWGREDAVGALRTGVAA